MIASGTPLGMKVRNVPSGEGCRPLVQSLLYGEAASLSELCALSGNETCANEFGGAALEALRQRVLRSWNANISSFDTMRGPQPPGPPPPTPNGYVPYGPPNTFCCDQSNCVSGHSTFLYQGELPPAACAAQCTAWPGGLCRYITLSDGGYCMNAEYCNTTNPFQGSSAVTYVRSAEEGEECDSLSSQALPPSQQQQQLPFSNTREEASLSSPWFFGAIKSSEAAAYADSWLTAFDPEGLGGPLGLRTAEFRSPEYYCNTGWCCAWSGSVWPFETSKTLTAAAAILQDEALSIAVPALSRARYWTLLSQYTAMHTRAWSITTAGSNPSPLANYSAINASGFFLSGLGVDWIAEDGCAETGNWTDSWEEGYWCLHSSYLDILMSTVCGLVPHAEAQPPYLLLQPLQPSDSSLTFWACDGVAVGGHIVTAFWDIDGTMYGRGAELSLLLDGVLAAHANTTQQALNVTL